MTVDEKRIREYAYQIWESEGRPEGQHVRHWEMACKLASSGKAQPRSPSPARKVTRPREAVQAAAPDASVTGSKPAAPRKPRAPRKVAPVRPR